VAGGHPAIVVAPHVIDAGSSSLVIVEPIRQAFAEMVAAGDGTLRGDLDRAALLIAAAVDDGVVISHQIDRLDALAEALPDGDAAQMAVALFGGAAHDPAVHFSGNHQEYYDHENSLLHRVLDRRRGIPISLAVLLIEVGRRRGIELHGVGMPGHFLVGSSNGYIDAFNGGVFLDDLGCTQLYQRLAGASAVLPAGALAATPSAHIVKRMLLNLAAIGVQQQQRRNLRAVRSLLATFPDADHRDHVQHAYAAAELGQFGEAATAGNQAMLTIPDRVAARLQDQINEWQARLN